MRTTGKLTVKYWLNIAILVTVLLARKLLPGHNRQYNQLLEKLMSVIHLMSMLMEMT